MKQNASKKRQSSKERRLAPADDTSRRTAPVQLPELLRQAREAMGLSIRRAAELGGIHHGILSRVEAGERRPAPETLQRLAAVFELDEADLFALAGYRLPERLPTFPAYLRAKYRMPEEAAKQLNEYFGYLAEKYDIDTREPSEPTNRRVQPRDSNTKGGQ